MWNYKFQLILILIQVSLMHDVGSVRGARASRIALLSIRWKKILDITSKRVKPITPGFPNIFSNVFDYWKENN